mmetsp:Transcript_22082/g.48033  ORF Transcript_22082/g.48033 Transcript_22082/m.48033 type:complete len:547 (-) Transcript_22082:1389-3029(-)|eukprot:CAMPEP_0168166282 /NCGR_PEP_ID=MMETSP0139_2-20121125/1940_1 /TAXON_ID=44445 /ORGANISM="Pseudo-nitzschia australis, Strain 10249 10 AB" /LENGTH=546 /DNA_ID=CAMNT_0008083461 /DNA_START=62 /DNA_END=1702 /DNA_ORIENTATION=-
MKTQMIFGSFVIAILVSVLGNGAWLSNIESMSFDDIVGKDLFSPPVVSHASRTMSTSTAMPKTLVIYFPQYHRDPLNDKNWGDNFTDWNSLRDTPRMNKMKQQIPRPLLPTSETETPAMTNTNTNTNASKNDHLPPPLGYYDLKDTEPRRTQGILAKKYDIDGFIYHHYWFYDKSHKGPNLAKPLENMLKDGHPDLPFMLNWCAVKWVNVWMGKAIFQTIPTNKNRAITLQEQYFDPTQEMIYEHFLWLKQFFEHPNYIRVNGQPAFLLYYYDPRALPILESLRKFAVEDGFSGLHFIVGRSSHPEELFTNTSHLNNIDKSKLQTLDLVDPTKTKSYSRSILPALLNINNISISPPLLKPTKEERTWDYNPFNQTMTYPYPLSFLTRPFEVPAWCTDPTKIPSSAAADDESGNLRLHPNHPEIIGVITTFDNTPRRKFKEATIWNGGESPDDAIQRFAKTYTAALYHQKCCVDVALLQQQKQPPEQKSNPKLNLNVIKNDDRFVVINAMNEWAEGMSIEPSDVYGYRWLETIKEVKKTVENQPCIY